MKIKEIVFLIFETVFFMEYLLRPRLAPRQIEFETSDLSGRFGIVK